MARLAHTQNYVLMHPGREQVGRVAGRAATAVVQAALTCLHKQLAGATRALHLCQVCPPAPAPLAALAAQVARQPAMEALPLVMEPRSRLYTDPLVVLDFQVWLGWIGVGCRSGVGTG